MNIYISIPITGHDYQEQKKKARKLAEAIRGLGHEPVNPFEVTAAPSHLSEQEEYAFYMGQDIEELLLCDAIFLTRDWASSKGCRLEYNVAKIYEKQIYYKLAEIPEVE